MLIIELTFPSGRYHATSWGRNVNEGVPEWPPSPYRLARALIDTWKRRKPDWQKNRVKPILKALSASPLFYLPPAVSSHTRSYLSSNEQDISKKQLVFDAFVALKRDDKVLIGFDQELEGGPLKDLKVSLEEMNYLGRSESWVKADLATRSNGIEWNCVPSSSESSFADNEMVRVACLSKPERYMNLSVKPEMNWQDAICMSTRDCLKAGWSDPPALMWVNYMRPAQFLIPLPDKKISLPQAGIRYAKYALHSKVLPRIQETVPFAERVRGHLMGIHKRIQNNDPTLVSPLFSGKGPDGKPLKNHVHVFYLPLDEDGDGRLDHILVYTSVPFSQTEILALDQLRSVWQPDGRPDVNFVLVSISPEIALKKSSRWVSVTPFVTSRHYRKGRGTYDDWMTNEIKIECSFHGLPQPDGVKWIPHTMATSHPIRWMEFVRSRKNSTPPKGQGCILSFPEQVAKPFALGSGCHFGLGQFVQHINN